MAKQYSVCQMRDTGYSSSANNSGGKKSVQITINVSYRVIVTDPADPDFTGADVTDLEVAFAPGLPLVNYNTYYDFHNNVGMPLAVCKSKSVKRDSSASNMFVVSCSFQTEPASSKNGKTQEKASDATQPPPATPTDVDPVVSYSMGVIERVLDSAPAYATDDSALGELDTNLLPCDQTADCAGDWGEEFRMPVTKKVPTVTMTITQFESTWSWEKILERGYKVNNAAWGADSVVKAWMITNINAVEQSVKIDDGAGGVTDAEWYRVTYTITRDAYTVSNYNTATNLMEDLFVGHAAALPLMSKKYIEYNPGGTDVVKKFLTEDLDPFIGKVDVYAVPLPDDAAGPNYVRFDTVDELNFSFLQWQPGEII